MKLFPGLSAITFPQHLETKLMKNKQAYRIMSMVIAVFFVLATAIHPLAAAESTLTPGPEGELVWYRINLQEFPVAHKKKGDKAVHVQVVGGQATVVALHGPIIPINEKGVTLKASSTGFTGQQIIRIGRNEIPLVINATINDGNVSGTWSLLNKKGSSDQGKRVPGKDLSGTITGTVVSSDLLETDNSFTGKASWDSYLGTEQNFAATKTDVPLVDSFRQARRLWSSPFIGGMQIGDVRHGFRLDTPIVGGPATPLVSADGRVYQFHCEPVHDGAIIPQYRAKYNQDKKGQGKTRVAAYAAATGRTTDQVLRRFALAADEHMSCFDARTGRLLWRRTWSGAGVNYIAHKSAFSNQTGCLGDGRVFVFGTLGVVRALDAQTGEELWSTAIPGYAEQMQAETSDGKYKPVSRSYAHGLNLIGGVVICPTGISSSKMAGIDAKSGKVLWEHQGALAKTMTPIRWTHQGKEYIIGMSNKGSVVCLDPRTGAELWSGPEGRADNIHQPSLEGDYLLTKDGCYQLSLKGAKLIWDIPKETTFDSRSAGILYRGLAWIRGGKESGLTVRKITDGSVVHHDATRAPKAEAVTWAAEGKLIYNHESQHNRSHTFEILSADAQNIPALGAGEKPWYPTHKLDLSYVIMTWYPIVEGRIFMRGRDGIHCYDLRK